MKTYISNNETETIAFAKEFAKNIKSNAVIALNGELGSGKTKFTQGILEYFGLAEEISSPTFTIVNEYKNSKATIYHFDVYRLNNIDDFFDMGGDEYFGNGICIIEWANIIDSILPIGTIYVDIDKDEKNNNARKITIKNDSTNLNIGKDNI